MFRLEKVFQNDDGSVLDEQTFENAYRVYVENRRAVNQAAIDNLNANIEAVAGQRDQTLKRFAKFKTDEGLEVYKAIDKKLK